MSDILTTSVIHEVCASKDEWLHKRQFAGIGASEAAAVLGEHDFLSPYQLWAQKRGLVESSGDSEAAEWGLRLEEPIAQKFAEETGRAIETPPPYRLSFNSAVCAYAFATLDREIVTPWRGPLELKTTGAHNEPEWEEGPPRRVWIQIQHQMAIVEAERASVAVLIGGQMFRWQDLERDQAFINVLMPEIDRFWRENVLGDVAPEPDGSWRTKEILDKIYPQHSSQTIALDADAIAWDEELCRLKSDIKALRTRQDYLENLFRERIGDNAAGLLPNGVSYSWKAQTRASYVVAESTYRVLRRHAAKIGGRS